MSLEEFTVFVYSIADKNFPKGDIPLYFNLSITNQVNEIDSGRHYKMEFKEFIEAMCRVVDKLSPHPPNDNLEDWPIPKRQDQHLAAKLENLINVFLNGITNNDYKFIKDRMPLPKKDEESELYKYDSVSSFYYILLPKTTSKFIFVIGKK